MSTHARYMAHLSDTWPSVSQDANGKMQSHFAGTPVSLVKRHDLCGVSCGHICSEFLELVWEMYRSCWVVSQCLGLERCSEQRRTGLRARGVCSRALLWSQVRCLGRFVPRARLSAFATFPLSAAACGRFVARSECSGLSWRTPVDCVGMCRGCFDAIAVQPRSSDGLGVSSAFMHGEGVQIAASTGSFTRAMATPISRHWAMVLLGGQTSVTSGIRVYSSHSCLWPPVTLPLSCLVSNTLIGGQLVVGGVDGAGGPDPLGVHLSRGRFGPRVAPSLCSSRSHIQLQRWPLLHPRPEAAEVARVLRRLRLDVASTFGLVSRHASQCSLGRTVFDPSRVIGCRHVFPASLGASAADSSSHISAHLYVLRHLRHRRLAPTQTV